ncbi:hypothetical protein LCGC14_1675430 [marine sediment metagenome]|uniref:Uncharacterized protein n=1 Tax=marine sediment metagenome TaxID=412755 RepID=A0A0F9KPZ3_9ZZZZ
MNVFMHLLTILMVIYMFALPSCAVRHIPSEDIYVMFATPMGPIPLELPKGYLDEENKGETWVPVDEPLVIGEEEI